MINRDLIVVGVDGSEGARRALRWAITEGRRTGSAVEAVTVWAWDGVEGPMLAATSPGFERERAEAISQREFNEVLAGVSGQSQLSREVVEGHPVAALLAAARTARLLVLGSHGHGRLHHAVMGSIAEECVRGATCPVVVIPVPQHEPAHQTEEPVPVS